MLSFRVFAQLSLFLMGFALVGCLQTENSSSLDATAYSGGGSPEFIAARAIFKQKCTSCHYHAFEAKTQAEFFAANCTVSGPCIIQGDLNNSPIYYRAQGSGGTKGPKNMPTDGTLSASELQVLVTWMQSATP